MTDERVTLVNPGPLPVTVSPHTNPEPRLVQPGESVEIDAVGAASLIASGWAVAERDELPGAPARNASREAWAEYADDLGVPYDISDGRDALIALVEAAAHTTDPEGRQADEHEEQDA